MDALVEKALANGAEAAKVCGAGGGGCIAFLCAEGRKPDVENALAAAAGAEVLKWKVSARRVEGHGEFETRGRSEWAGSQPRSGCTLQPNVAAGLRWVNEIIPLQP